MITLRKEQMLALVQAASGPFVRRENEIAQFVGLMFMLALDFLNSPFVGNY